MESIHKALKPLCVHKVLQTRDMGILCLAAQKVLLTQHMLQDTHICTCTHTPVHKFTLMQTIHIPAFTYLHI